MLLSLTLIGSGEVDLFFLKNEDTNNATTNSFFCCNVKNSDTLIWEINRVGISQFEHLKDVIAGTTSYYSYSASLLSLRNNLGEYTLDSVIIVTAPTGLTVNVNCVSTRGSNTTSNLVDPINKEDNEPIRNDTVNVQPVFLTNTTIVTDGNNINTRAFLCDSINSGDLSWEADTANRIEKIAFNSSSDIGRSDSRLTDEEDTVRLQAITLGEHHEKFYSILYVTDVTFEEVRCIAGGNTVEYSTPKNLISTTSEGMYIGGDMRDMWERWVRGGQLNQGLSLYNVHLLNQLIYNTNFSFVSAHQ